MIKKRWLMRNDQIIAVRSGMLQDIHRRHHGHGNAVYLRVWIARLKRIYRRLVPADRNLVLNGGDYFARSRLGAL